MCNAEEAQCSSDYCFNRGICCRTELTTLCVLVSFNSFALRQILSSDNIVLPLSLSLFFICVFRFLVHKMVFSVFGCVQGRIQKLSVGSGGSRHLVWEGPRGAEGAEWRRGAKSKAVSPSPLGRGPSAENFSIFYFKRCVLVDSDVLNVPVTRTRA